MGFEPFDPYGEWKNQKEDEQGNNQTDPSHMDDALYVEADFMDDDLPAWDAQEPAVEEEESPPLANDTAQAPHEKNVMEHCAQVQDEKQDKEVAPPVQRAADSVPKERVSGTGMWNQWATQTRGEAHTPTIPSPTAQTGPSAFPQDAAHVPVNVVPKYEIDRRQASTLPRPQKRIGMYILLVCILLVSLLTCLMIIIGAFAVLGTTSSYEENFYSGTMDEDIRMPKLKPLPPEGRSVPKFGSTLAAYSFSNTDAPTAEIKDAVGPAVVGVVDKVIQKADGKNEEYRSGAGSGIVLSEDGYIVTNYHVIANSDKIYIVFEGETDEIPAELIGYDDIRDVAVLKVALNHLTAPIYGDSAKVRTGEMAVAIGNPLGTLKGTITQGIISAASRELTLEAGRKQDFIQTDTAINPGNSGGALLNRKGEVIGMNTRKETTVAFDDWGLPVAAEGIGYAIPINDVLDIAEALIRNGRIERAQLGVTLQTVMPNENNIYETHPGALVTSVVKKGPADEAGIRKDDIVIEFDDQKVESLGDISNGLEKKAVGERAQLTIWRDGKELKYVVTLRDLDEAE